MAIMHTFVSTKIDSPDTSLVRPTNWNADHTIDAPIPIASGGTGAGTAADAINALVPSQGAHTGEYLKTDGSVVSWAAAGGGGVTAPYTLAGVGDTVPFTINGISGQTANLQSWKANNVEFAYVNSAGVFTAPDFIATSDVRYKENIVTIDDALNKVLAMRGVHYNRKDDQDKRMEMGVIAQELRTVCPELVWANNEGMLSVSYSRMVAVLIEAIKLEHAKVEALEQRIVALGG
jgi:hypothetical protein